MLVKELIAKLQALPADASVVISDADTEWELPVNVSFETFGSSAMPGRAGVVYLWGDYYGATP